MFEFKKEMSISNKTGGDPIPIDVPVNLNREYLDAESERHFFICGHCGKMQPNVLNSSSPAD